MGLVEHDSSQLSTWNKLCSKRERGLMLYSLLCVTIDFWINGLSMTCIKNVEATSRCQSLRLFYALYTSKMCNIELKAE